MKKGFKYHLLFLVYLWLRFDPVLRLAFGKNWNVRAEFLNTLFDKDEVASFLEHRGQLVKTRSKQPPPLITPSSVDKQVEIFLKQPIGTKTGREKRLQILTKLKFWALDKDINQSYIESYKTRAAIVDAFLTIIFPNSLVQEAELILRGLKKIVFSRVTYLGTKGEPSPIVHHVILDNVVKLLHLHFNEVNRLREEQMDKMTKVKLIKEIQKTKKDTGSFAFSGDLARKDDQFRHKFPLPKESLNLLLNILQHYRFSAWPDSRQRAEDLIASLEDKHKFSLEDYLSDS